MNDLDKIIEVVISKKEISEIDLTSINLNALMNVTTDEINSSIKKQGKKGQFCTDGDVEIIINTARAATMDKRIKLAEISKIINKKIEL